MEIVSLNFGQCGLQLANVYWTRVADELRAKGVDTRPYRSLYKNADLAGLDSHRPRYELLEPRCILVDTEMGPATQVMQEADANLISADSIIAGTDAPGNNWATAFKDFGAKYSDTMEELVATILEDCDQLEYFNLTFGLSGGTGSGLGTYAAELLSDLYPKVPKLANIVTNTNVSAVAPYNNLLALDKLEEHATLIVPFSNDHIFESVKAKGLAKNGKEEKQKTYFETINNLISDFEHRMNVMTVDLNFPRARVNSVVNGLLPFENMNYTCPFKSPIKDASDQDTTNLENTYNELFRPANRISPIPTESQMLPLVMSMFTNGKIEHLKHAKGLKLRSKMYGWNRDGIKVNILHPFAPRTGRADDESVIALGNHTGISHYLDQVALNVSTLLKKKAFLHHFESLVGAEEICHTMVRISETSQRYKDQHSAASGLFSEVLDENKANRIKELSFVESIRKLWPFNLMAKGII